MEEEEKPLDTIEEEMDSVILTDEDAKSKTSLPKDIRKKLKNDNLKHQKTKKEETKGHHRVSKSKEKRIQEKINHIKETKDAFPKKKTWNERKTKRDT